MFCRLFANQNKQAASQGYYEKAMRMAEKHHGNDSAELIALYQDMGKISFVTFIKVFNFARKFLSCMAGTVF